ncbi:MAG: hypothetical protein V1650_01990, partial [Candidatus Omnitrophota bacterium]
NENLAKQSKLNDAYLDNLIGVDLYKEKVSLLREAEAKIKAEIGKCKIRLVQKERSEAYLRVLKLAVDNFDETDRKMDIIQKKETLKLIFKSIEVNGCQITKVHLYQPFQEIYDKIQKSCNTFNHKELTSKIHQNQEACILQPTAAK